MRHKLLSSTSLRTQSGFPWSYYTANTRVEEKETGETKDTLLQKLWSLNTGRLALQKK